MTDTSETTVPAFRVTSGFWETLPRMPLEQIGRAHV